MTQLSMVIIDRDNESRAQLIELLEQVSYIEIIADFENLLVGYDIILQEKPQLIFIDLSENVDLALETIEKIVTINKGCIIFASAEKVNTDVVIKAMRCGAREFLTKPILLEDLSSALRKARSILSNEKEEKTGEILTVFSNKGGIGKTTIATNLALQLAETTGKRVCLVDLNLQLGDVTTFLDINPSFDIAYVVTHLSRLDESFLFSSLEKYKDKDLYILADPPYVEQAEEISADDITSILNFLRSMFAYIVVDTSSNFDVKTLTCLDISDYVLLVSMVNLPSIRNCQRCMDLLKRLEYDPEKVRLIVNRYVKDDEITVEDVEEALDHPVFWRIPNSYFVVMSSINKGIPIAELDSESEISKNIRKLAEKISGAVNVVEEEKEEKTNMVKLPGNIDISSIMDKLKTLNLPFLKQAQQ
jgi:pilus assembly protein CpaE